MKNLVAIGDSIALKGQDDKVDITFIDGTMIPDATLLEAAEGALIIQRPERSTPTLVVLTSVKTVEFK